jgi:hypothetical protein
VGTVKPGTPKALIRETSGGLEVSIPAPRNPVLLFFLPVWLVGWAFGWVSAFADLTAGKGVAPSLFLLPWLVFWTLGGVFAVVAFAWSAAGREVVTLGPSSLILSRRVLGLGRSREYDLTHVAQLRATPQGYDRSGMRAWGFGGGTIAFDYGASTVRFGSALEEGEAGMVVRQLAQRRPSLSSMAGV